MAVDYRTDPEYFERLDGVVYPKVSPRTKHAWVQGMLLVLLRAQGRDYGKVGPEWKFRVGRVDGTDSWLLPDVAFVTNERLRPLVGGDREEPPFAPDIAVEVRSPSERRSLRERKITRYLATGSLLVLDVDPQARTVRAIDAASDRTFTEGDRVTHPAFPWLALDVREAFVDLD